MIRPRFAYTLLLYLVLPLALVRLWWRGRRQPAYRLHVGERFGRYAMRVEPGCIWVHAVSVGETRGAQPVVERLLKRYPGKSVLMTHMTPTGRETGEQLYGSRVQRCYLPYDYPGAVARFLDHFKPSCGLLIDTEIWFNLIHACSTRAIPLHLANARLSEKSFAGYARFRSLVRAGLNELTSIAAQSREIAQRFEALGARNVHVVGNVKFDIEPASAQVELGRTWRERWGATRPVWLAASTREGEETLVLDALDQVRIPGLLTVIVPRHPQRFDEVARLIAARGLSYWRRSDGSWPNSEPPRVLLGDSMGEMSAYYAACDVAFIGGSLRPFGAHNLLEACALAKPVIVGPWIYNFQDAVESGIAAGGVVRVPDPAALAVELNRLLSDPQRRAAMGEAARAFTAAHRGAVDRLFTLLEL